MFAVSTHCGHSLCLQCALDYWFQAVTVPPRINSRLQLREVICPVCRKQYPVPVFDPAPRHNPGRTREIRVASTMPYIRNVSLGELISSLYDDIHMLLEELRAILPHDPQVLDWTNMFDRQHGTECRRYQEALRYVNYLESVMFTNGELIQKPCWGLERL